MNSSIRCFAFLAVVVCTVLAYTENLPEDVVASYADAFEKYQVKFNKHYTSKKEYSIRLRAYATSMERVKELNEEFPETHYGETPFSDALPEEKVMKAVRIPVPKKDLMKREGLNENTFPQPKLAQDHTADNIPDEFNWFNVSGVKKPARNQGNCGSCWAFSAIGALEMQAALEGNKYYNVSVQQAIDCGLGASATSKGCCGGFPGDAFNTTQLWCKEKDYAYNLTRWDQGKCAPFQCRSKGLKTVVEINGYDKFIAMTAEELKKQIWMYGPISVYMEAPDRLRDYTGGIFKCTSNAKEGNHYVVAVGFGPNYIALRNSWGYMWGLEGDFLLSTESVIASCQLLGPRNPPYYQMARVSVKFLASGAFRTLPFMTIAMLIAFLLF